MRTLRLVLLGSLAGALLPACSLVFNGSRFTSGGGADAGPDTDSGPADGGPPADCTEDRDCPDDHYCYDDGTGSPLYCAPCDGDGDGFVVMHGVRCAPMMRPFDCDDGDPSVHPGALPICNDEIDQSCGVELPGTLMPIDEVGFFGVQPVMSGAGGLPRRVEVFSMSPDDALLFFQIDDGRGTPIIARVPLTAGGMASVETDSLPDLTRPDAFPNGTIYYDAHRDQVANVRFGMLVQDGDAASPTYLSLQTTFRADGGFSNLPGGRHDLGAAGLDDLVITAQPSMVQNGSQFYWGVPARLSLAGGPPMDVVMTMGADGSHIDVMHDDVDPTAPWGSVSDGENAVFPGPFNTLRVWNGSLESSDQAEALEISPGIASVGRPGIASLRSSMAGNEVTALVIPGGSEAFLYLLDCSSTAALGTCPFTDGSPPIASYSLPTMGGDPHIQIIPVSSTAVGVMFVQHTTGDDSIGFGFAETMPLTEALMPFDVPAPGRGPVVELDGDFLVSPIPGAGPMAAQVTLSYAYLRHIDGQPPQLFVGGARVCAGVGHD